MNKEYNILVLGGGSIKGFSILGALQYAKDNDLLNNITTYSGTSIGSIICYLLIIGYSPIEILVCVCVNQVLDHFKNLDLINLVNGKGAVEFIHLQNFLEKLTLDKTEHLLTLEELYTKFGSKLICCTYNLTKQRIEYIDYENHPKLSCITALRMSSNIPLFFEKFWYNNFEYIDGGIADNFPISITDKSGNQILGINTIENSSNIKKSENFMEYILRILYIPFNQANKYSIKNTSERCSIVSIIV